ncbi:MAG: hypothetical protein RLZZ221_1038, partial [Verrucomicrobiota bacterium]
MNRTVLTRRLPLALALALAPFAGAQTAPTPPRAGEETVKLEAFTVTGSNIKRIEVEKVLPVTVIDAVAHL